jgi:hypothetical protein
MVGVSDIKRYKKNTFYISCSFIFDIDDILNIIQDKLKLEKIYIKYNLINLNLVEIILENMEKYNNLEFVCNSNNLELIFDYDDVQLSSYLNNLESLFDFLTNNGFKIIKIPISQNSSNFYNN